MSTQRITCVLLGLLASPLAACSLVKLSDDVTQGHCERDTDCEELNADPKFGDDPCQRWQCDSEDKLCRYGALDADHDGQSPATVMAGDEAVACEKDSAKQDCADDDETVGAGFDELCDEKDNDCDGRSDEGALEISSSRAVVFEAASEITGATDAAYARDPMSGAVALAYSAEQNVNHLPGASLLDPALAERASAAKIAVDTIAAPTAEQTAVTPLDGGRFAYAFVNLTGKPVHVVAGVWGTDANRVSMLEGIATAGVHCLAGESCENLFAPALASQDSDVLLAYLRFNSDPSSVVCGDLRGGDTTADVLVNVLSRPPAKEWLQEESASALRLGASSDLSPPALLTLPAIGDVAPSWLAAYADENGDVVVQQLRRDRAQVAVLSASLIRIGGNTQHSSLALAVGASSENGLQLGIAYQRGCAGKARAALDVWQLKDDGGELAAQNVFSAVVVGGESNEGLPALAYSAARKVWLVSWQDRLGMYGRIVDSDGTLHGDAPYPLIANVRSEGGGGEVNVSPVRMAAFDLGSDFATIAHVRRSETDPNAFEVAKLGCEKSDR